MATTTHFNRGNGVLTVNGDRHNNTITIGRDAAGYLQLNGEDIHSNPTNANTSLIRVYGNADNDIITLDETNALPSFTGGGVGQVGPLARAELHGGAGNDVLTGGSYPDQLFGDAGDDVVNGGAGIDVLHGGDGNDILIGGQSDDQVFGDAGNDRMIWNPGDGSDLFEGGAGFDVAQINGPNANESFTIAANGARVNLTGAGAQAFSLDIGTTEQIVLDAGRGSDTVTVNDLTGTSVRQVTIDLAAVPATRTGDGHADTVTVNATNNADHVVLSGSGGAVIASGLFAQVAVNAMEAGDTFVVHGLGGNDNIDASLLTTPVNLVIDGGDGNDVIRAADFSSNLLGGAGDDILIGSAGNDHLTGNDGKDVLLGGDGDNVIDGGAGNDQIITNDGRDFLQGGVGDDFINAGGGNDTVEGDSGTDTMFAGDGDDLFIWNAGDGSDADDGGAGTDTLVFNGSSASEHLDISANGTRVSLTRDVGQVSMDLNSVEHLAVNASGGADTVTINDLTGTGVTATDVNLGSGGANTNGDGADDTVVINGTAGADAITLSIVNGELVVDGLAGGKIFISHFDANDTFVFNGLGGDDVIDASAIGTNGPKLIINGGDGADVLIGSSGNDEIHGGNGDDVLLGGPGVDVLDGGPGDNVIIQDFAAPHVANAHHFDLG